MAIFRAGAPFPVSTGCHRGRVPDDIYDPRNRRMSITLAWETQDHNDPSAAMRDSIGASLKPDKAAVAH